MVAHTIGDASKPSFVDIDNDRDLDLFCGNYYGKLIYYENTGDSIAPQYTYVTDYYQEIDVGERSAPCFVDIDSDGDYDLFIGEWYGHIYYYKNEGEPDTADFIEVTNNFLNINVPSKSSPTFADIDGDRDFDFFVGENNGNIWYYRNEGDSANYDFVYVTDNYMGIDVGDHSVPYFCDIDDDGDYDLFVGKGNYVIETTALGYGDVKYYENIGDPQNADFQLVQHNVLALTVGNYAYPEWADIDNDGDRDLFVGETYGNLNFFRNEGTIDMPSFVFEDEFFNNNYYYYVK